MGRFANSPYGSLLSSATYFAQNMSSLPISVNKCVTETPPDQEVQPYQRSGHCCATDGANLYVFGGYHPEYITNEPGVINITVYHEIFKDLWCYNFATKKWSKQETTGPAPSQTASMSMILSGNTLILFGGTVYPWGSKSNDKVYTLNLSEKKWKVLECTGSIPGKYGQAMTISESALYVYGGCRRITVEEHLFDSELYRLDMRSHEWQLILGEDCRDDGGGGHSLATIRGMYRHGLVIHGDKLYVIGSSWEEIWHLRDYNKVHVFDLSTQRWSWEPTIPSEDSTVPHRRAYHSCVQWKSEVYMCGGHDHHQVLDDIWCLHLPELRWRRIHTSLEVPSFFHAAAITDTKCMYLFGGVRDLEDRVRTRVIQRVWLDIPPLAELCWHQLIHQCPSIVQSSKETLVSLGIPRVFIQRLKPGR